jgi:integrase
MAKKKQRGNGQGTVAPRKNKDGKIIGYRGAFFGPDGKRRWVGAKTKTECWRKLNVAMTDSDKGILPSPANLTVKKYLRDMWLANSVKGTVSRATYDGYRRDVNHHIIPELGRRKLKELTRDDIRCLYRRKRDEGLSNRTLSYIHTTLRKALKDAVGDDLIPRNPTDGVKPPETLQGVAKEPQALDPSEVRTLLEAARGDRLEALYVVALCTGLRRGEVLGLKWSDTDLEEGTLSVKRSLDVDGTSKTPKNRSSRRTLKLTTRALAALGAHKARQNEERLRKGDGWQDNDLIFPNTLGKPMNAGNFYRRDFQPLLESGPRRREVHLPQPTAHLRHHAGRQRRAPLDGSEDVGTFRYQDDLGDLHPRHRRHAGRRHIRAGECLQLKSNLLPHCCHEAPMTILGSHVFVGFAGL